MLYTYRIIKENVVTGARAKRCRKISRYEPLNVGGLYCHIGHGFPGFYRILELVAAESLDD